MELGAAWDNGRCLCLWQRVHWDYSSLKPKPFWDSMNWGIGTLKSAAFIQPRKGETCAINVDSKLVFSLVIFCGPLGVAVSPKNFPQRCGV